MMNKMNSVIFKKINKFSLNKKSPYRNPNPFKTQTKSD